MNVPEPKLAYPLDEACWQLGGITRPTLYRLLNTGALRSVQVGTRRLVRHVDLVEFLERSAVDDVRPGESLSARAKSARQAQGAA